MNKIAMKSKNQNEDSDITDAANDELSRFMDEQYDLQRREWVTRSYRNRNLMILIFFPIFMAVVLFVPTIIRNAITDFFITALNLKLSSMQMFTVIYVLFLLIPSFSFLASQSSVIRLNTRSMEIQNKIEQTYLLLPKLRMNYLQKQYLIHSGRAGRVSWIDMKRRESSDRIRRQIGNALSELEKPNKDRMYDWDDVQLGLTQWDELLKEEEREVDDQKRWKFMSVGIAITYLIILLFGIPVFSITDDIFGIPFTIVVWSAIGSFAAILYRFYKSPRRINFEIEFRWYLARPIIGIVMGTLTYLALLSGLLIFGADRSTTPSSTIQKTGEMAQYWIVAFLAGFSDKFYESIIELLVGKFGTGEEKESETYTEKTESKVEITTEKQSD